MVVGIDRRQCGKESFGGGSAKDSRQQRSFPLSAFSLRLQPSL